VIYLIFYDGQWDFKIKFDVRKDELDGIIGTCSMKASSPATVAASLLNYDVFQI